MAAEATNDRSLHVYLLTPEQLADQWELSEQTLAHWRSEGRGPKFVRLGRSIRYHVDDLKAYIEANQHSETVK